MTHITQENLEWAREIADTFCPCHETPCKLRLEIIEALKQSYERGLEKAAEVAEDIGDVALLLSQTQKNMGSQNTQKGIAIGGQRIATEIRALKEDGGKVADEKGLYDKI